MRLLSTGSTIDDVIRHAELPALETRLLLGYALNLSRVQLITQGPNVLSDDELQRINALIERRLTGEPIAYLLGEREFYGLSFEVTPSVLIPRPDTELLVECAIAHLPQGGQLLDMGTGSGAIAIAIAHTRADAQISALDVSPAALDIAHRNAQRNKVDVRFLHSSWFDSLPDNERFDVIVSNPPYIASGDPHLAQGDLRFEPVDALTDHHDGLSDLRILSKQSAQYLKSGGWLLMEHGYDQAESVRTLLVEHGFEEVQSWRDLAGIERVSGGKRAD